MRSIVGPAAIRGRRIPYLALVIPAVALIATPRSSASPAIPASIAMAAVGQGEYGTIKGRLVWGGDQIPPIRVLCEKGKAEKDPQVCASTKPILSRELVVDPKTKGVEYAFAYISRPKGSNPSAIQKLLASKPKVEIDQSNCEFLPYLSAIYKDQTLIVKSSDAGINHNVRLVAFNNPGLNQNVSAGSQLEMHLVPERLPVKILCDIHPWMQSYVMVFDHPFFTTTGKDGSFEIDGVPAGTQKLVLWQEKVGYANKGAGRGMSVEVKAGQVTDVGEIVLDPAKVKS